VRVDGHRRCDVVRRRRGDRKRVQALTAANGSPQQGW